ncbi:uncharacterized protein CLUP02_13244 [Colletotrichum lupini]|uniref:Integral membrane protein n=1 Tax=Colletotrichum lupini TaxID=145971 RepID=A0A9Q8WM55_9PEZI|nr:uncharacterized protein CLUP02_13244 [Colletotrichum lupini]UQC87725.1 hypothetical protein CLUP02_13244 [Colletotrichum lupini]
MIARDSDPGINPLEVPAILFGITIGLTMLATFKASQQTFQIYSRTKSATKLYPWMIWIFLLTNISQAVTNWLLAHGDFVKSIGSSIGSCMLWILQTQLAPQILANRLGLLLVDKKRAKMMKFGLLVIVGVINISVTCIYIAGYSINPKYFTHLHKIWDPIDKVVDLLIDISLNTVFLRIIQHEFVADGLQNCPVCTTIQRYDLTTITQLHNPIWNEPYLYAMTHPMAYTMKLIIEMTMADLISSIAKRPHQMQEFSEQICTVLSIACYYTLPSKPFNQVWARDWSLAVSKTHLSWFPVANFGNYLDSLPATVQRFRESPGFPSVLRESGLVTFVWTIPNHLSKPNDSPEQR